MDLPLDPSPPTGSEEEGEFESTKKSTEPNVGQDRGLGSAGLTEQPQLGRSEERQAEAE